MVFIMYWKSCLSKAKNCDLNTSQCDVYNIKMLCKLFWDSIEKYILQYIYCIYIYCNVYFYTSWLRFNSRLNRNFFLIYFAT